ANFLIAEKEREFSEAMRLATGVRLDALADAETVAPGDTFNVAVRVFVGDEQLARVRDLALRAPAGWRVERIDAPQRNPALGVGNERPQAFAYFRVTVPADAQPTQPYWLQRPRKGDMYVWTKDDPQTLPFAPALVNAEAILDASAPLTITQPVEYRTLDAVRGEVRRDINVVPAQAVDLDPPLLIVPTSPRAELRRVIVQVTNNRAGAAGGRVRLRTDAPSLAQIQPSEIPVGFKAKGERATGSFDVRLLPTTEARPNFCNGRLLTAEDLSTEQQAYRLKQRL